MEPRAEARFVVLRHERGRSVHFDLMLERGGRLDTWKFSAQPRSRTSLAGIRLAPHRTHYLTYEGPVSGGRGTVARVDEGTYRVKGRGADRLIVVFHGKTLRGEATLSRKGEDDSWEFVAAHDRT